MKLTRSHLLTIVYCLFVLLYTLYISPRKHGWYYLKFLLISGYLYFILQGILFRSRNWGVLLLLPPANLLTAVLMGYILLFILRLGGGTLLDADRPDMIVLSLIYLTLSFFSLRFISTKKAAKRKKK
ncbi:hypothetical protein Q4E93_07850 [Flavitalea sp. BT771]|uniref:hypothetical protein n=1 Tax=Flavitalea sp. BT771 TaxID=3063329 RepID=UPI0026E346A5|nr:hypothetical protein [Flavitalea sp. BT771]MDO6430494.1 hypothetical protein [Flavitalea sp. BT771]MDV6219366.1 hypothetical protein [Flavitalea sp. BT771]